MGSTQHRDQDLDGCDDGDDDEYGELFFSFTVIRDQ